ncbi:hypothetical protein BGZ46_006089 [Entomortierella lignicola]|nr:hypothetical protein BGZ46_006089 [Entomortierella lignicola]
MPVISSLESSCQDSTSGTQSRITSDRSDINDVHPRASEEKRFSKDSSLKDVDITLTTDRSCPGLVKENKLVSMSNSSREPVSEPKEKSAKQRKRKAERDRKKAKSRLKKLAIADEQMALDTAPEILHMQEDRGILRQDIINSSSKTKRKRTRNRKSRILDESNSLDPTTETKNATKTRRAMEPSSGASLPTQGRSQFKWNCSICGQQWKQKKAWNGHLLSAQHMRRVLQTMQKTMSPIAPYGCEDVQASKDMFGWGTAVGMVEEEEEEDEESEDEVLAAVDEMPANLEVIDHSSDDDMDLEE